MDDNAEYANLCKRTTKRKNNDNLFKSAKKTTGAKMRFQTLVPATDVSRAMSLRAGRHNFNPQAM